MKVLIEIDETLIDKTIWLDVNNLDTEDLELMRYAIRNGTPLNGTNGEVLMKMFPPSVYFPSEGKYMALLTKDCVVSCSNVEWWNADYKGVE